MTDDVLTRLKMVVTEDGSDGPRTNCNLPFARSLIATHQLRTQNSHQIIPSTHHELSADIVDHHPRKSPFLSILS